MLSSFEDRGSSLLIVLEIVVFFVSYVIYLLFVSLDYLYFQIMVYLEGFIEQSSIIDEFFVEQVSWEESQDSFFFSGSEVLYKDFQLSSVDLSLISKFGDNIGELQEKVDLLFVVC